MSLAEEEERAPCVRSGQQQRQEAGKQAEAASGWRAPLLHGEALPPLHRQVGAQPHTLGKEQATAAKVMAILRQRHHHREAEQEGQKVADALRKEKIVERHGGATARETASREGDRAGSRGPRVTGTAQAWPEPRGRMRSDSACGSLALHADACAPAERGARLRSEPRTAPTAGWVAGLWARRLWARQEFLDGDVPWEPGWSTNISKSAWERDASCQ